MEFKCAPTTPQVKATCKNLGISQTGEKALLVWRARLYAECSTTGLHWEGTHPLLLTKAQVPSSQVPHLSPSLFVFDDT